VDEALKWLHFGAKLEPTMGVNLSIKDVPEEQVEILRQRAKRNHRSLQGELRAIVDEITKPEQKKPISEIVKRLQKLSVTHAEESTKWIRDDRDR
jgi:plasmid stability protein